MKMIPDNPPTWLRLLTILSACIGGSVGVLGWSVATTSYTSVYTVTRKYAGKAHHDFRIFSEVRPGGSSLDSRYSKRFFDAACRGDTLTIRGNGLRVLSRNGNIKSWEIDEHVRLSMLVTVAAFLPIMLLRRYQRAWLRCVCYGAVGIGATSIILFSIWFFIAPA